LGIEMDSDQQVQMMCHDGHGFFKPGEGQLIEYNTQLETDRDRAAQCGCSA